MTPFQLFDSLDHLQDFDKGIYLAIGVFDGVHLGHQAVIQEAVDQAHNSGGIAAVLTFHPHPSHFIPRREPVSLIMSPEVKNQRLVAMGVSIIIQQELTESFMHIHAEDFLAFLTQKIPTIKGFYVGENFHFGFKRKGDIALLKQQGNNRDIQVTGIKRVRYKEFFVSSTLIREQIQAGSISTANKCLGYTYSAQGIVIPGDQRGRTLGFPTLDIPWTPELKPLYGVYAVEIKKETSVEAPWEKAVANYGVRPTFPEAGNQPILEVHCLNPTQLTYGDSVTVRCHHFLRKEQKFDSAQALQAQITKDIEAAHYYLKDL